jgi:hypothetical protein
MAKKDSMPAAFIGEVRITCIRLFVVNLIRRTVDEAANDGTRMSESDGHYGRDGASK